MLKDCERLAEGFLKDFSHRLSWHDKRLAGWFTREEGCVTGRLGMRKGGGVGHRSSWREEGKRGGSQVTINAIIIISTNVTTRIISNITIASIIVLFLD